MKQKKLLYFQAYLAILDGCANHFFFDIDKLKTNHKNSELNFFLKIINGNIALLWYLRGNEVKLNIFNPALQNQQTKNVEALLTT